MFMTIMTIGLLWAIADTNKRETQAEAKRVLEQIERKEKIDNYNRKRIEKILNVMELEQNYTVSELVKILPAYTNQAISHDLHELCEQNKVIRKVINNKVCFIKIY